MPKREQTLGEYLGIEDPTQPVVSDAATAPNKPLATLSRKEFARQLLNSEEYKESLRWRIVNNGLPPQLEVLLYHYAYGKPTDVVEVHQTQTALDLSPEQLDERELQLIQRMKQLNASKTGGEGSVH